MSPVASPGLPVPPCRRVVVVLCAAWCRTCEAYGPVFERLRETYPALQWHWVDVEDEAEIVGEIDVQTFPTLVIADDGRPWFAGPVLPRAEAARQLLAQPLGGPRTVLDDSELYEALLAALERGRAAPGVAPSGGDGPAG